MESQDPPRESIPPDCTGVDITFIIITKTTANEWMQHFLRSRYHGKQTPITGTANAQRQITSQVKDIECNFAHRGVYYLENHVLRERNQDFLTNGQFAIKDETTGERYHYEFPVDRGRSNIRNRLMLTGDKEAIPRFDRVPIAPTHLTCRRQGFRGGIEDKAMPSFVESLYLDQRYGVHKKLHSDYTRSVYSSNGILHIFDPNLGVIKIDQYGNVM